MASVVRYYRKIDGGQHGLTGAVVHHLAAEHHLLAALRDEAKAQAVDAVHRRSRHLASME